MRYFIFPFIFLFNVTKQSLKWMTRGLFRVFKYAWVDTTKTCHLNNRRAKDVYTFERLRGPKFIDDEGVETKKRHRRGHRGGKKHRKYHNRGGHHAN